MYTFNLDTENVAELLLRYGANPNVKDSTGDTPLILAVSTGKFRNLKFTSIYRSNQDIKYAGS